jgi:transposase InsO family protein
MSRGGNFWDNSPMERFFRSSKTEWVPTKVVAHLLTLKSQLLTASLDITAKLGLTIITDD